MFVDHKEVAWTAFREIGLCQYVLHSSYGTHITLIIDILQLMHLIWLINYAIALFEVD